jgi:hypothetical protein
MAIPHIFNDATTALTNEDRPKPTVPPLRLFVVHRQPFEQEGDRDVILHAHSIFSDSGGALVFAEYVVEWIEEQQCYGIVSYARRMFKEYEDVEEVRTTVVGGVN